MLEHKNRCVQLKRALATPSWMPKSQRAGRSVMRYDVTLDTLDGDERRVSVVYSVS